MNDMKNTSENMNNNMYKNTYNNMGESSVFAGFERPTQLIFYDADADQYSQGIGFNDSVICLCCGSVFEVNEIIADAAQCGYTPFYKFKQWESQLVGDETVDRESVNEYTEFFGMVPVSVLHN